MRTRGTKKAMRLEAMRLAVALVLATLAAIAAPMRAWASVTASNPRVEEYHSESFPLDAGQLATWDCVWFGSYPQTYVDDEATIAALDVATGWDDSGDLSFGGVTYRRLQKSDATHSESSSIYWSWARKASPKGYCYFRWEPVKWRVLEVNGGTALVVSDVALDDRLYNEKYTNVTWETCTLRSWLNGAFWNDCLTVDQQAAVVEQTLVNADYIGPSPGSVGNLGIGGADTTDSVFLLAATDVWSGADATSHGFVTAYDTRDEARRCKASDYAHAMGASTETGGDYEGNCYWWLRSPGNDNLDAVRVPYDGSVTYAGNGVHFAYNAVRPALCISLASDQVFYAGTVSSNGDINEQGAPYAGEVGLGSIVYGTPTDGAVDLSIGCRTGGTSSISTTWKDSWFGSDFDGYHYTHELARACSVLATAAYKRDCIEGDLESLGFIDVMSYFPDKDGGYVSDWDECGYAFGIKTVEDSTAGKQVPLIAVVVRGTCDNGEWLSDFNVANESPSDAPPTHEAFARCRDRILDALADWAADCSNRLEGLDMGEARVFLTGHSRGAAVAGLMAATLDDGYTLAGHTIEPRNVTACTIASPTTSKTGRNDSLYGNVFNIVNPEDLIPKLPLGTWGYERLGNTLVLPSRTNTGVVRYRALKNEMSAVFSHLTDGMDYEPYLMGSATARLAALELGTGIPTVGALYDVGLWRLVGIGNSPHALISAAIRGFLMDGDKAEATVALADLARQMPQATAALVWIFADDTAASLVYQGATSADHAGQAHMGETYVSWMMALDGLDDFASTHTGLMVACPVDVRVYAPGGELVAEIVDGQVNEGLLEDGLAAWVDGDAKHVDLPDEEAYRVELTPTADGEMDVVLTHRDADDGAVEQAGYDRLSLVEGEAYELATTGGADGGTAIADAASLVSPGSEPVGLDYAVSGDEIGSIILSATAEGPGVAMCPVTATRGDYVTARATAEEGGSFEGWYEGGELVSAEADYQFRADGDRALVARFAAAPRVSLAGATVAVPGQTYTGRALRPAVTVTLDGAALAEGTDYTVAYANNLRTGTARVTVTGCGKYEGTATATFAIAKARNPIVAKGKTAKVKLAKVKKKAQVLAVTKVVAVSRAQGGRTYRVAKWTTAKAKKYLKVNARTGKVTVKKGTPKGTYAFKLQVRAAGNANYKAGVKTVTVKVVVK